MMRGLVTLAALACLAAPSAASAQAQSSPFTDGERAALHAEIRAYLLEHPELLLEVIQKLEQRQQDAIAETDRTLIADHAAAIFEDGYSFVAGNPEGGLTLVEFLDYQCGYCRRAHPELAALIAEDGDIRLIVKEMPILGPGSERAARAAIATLITAGPEAYATLQERLMGLTGEITDPRLDALLGELGHDVAAIRAAMDDPEVIRRLAETRALGETLAISGTPTFVLDDRMLRGYLPPEAMRTLLAEVRGSE